MHTELYSFIEKINSAKSLDTSIITWGSPVFSFGNLQSSKIATLGLNPSNKEFVDNYGNELSGNNRRFHTLKSLGLNEWGELTEQQLDLILELCEQYFYRNPYDLWFKKLDYIISGTSMSYYFPSSEACHLDLIPYATHQKWAELSNEQRTTLLDLSEDILGVLLKHSPIKVLVLNGQSVVDNLEKMTGLTLNKNLMPNWTLPRKDSKGVSGYSYTGSINKIGSIKLKKSILVLGYNHNIQSSFGVTSKVQAEIRNWISDKVNDFLYETGRC